MKLYLLRHAEAADAHPDSSRPLTAKGRADAQALGTYLNTQLQLQVDAIWHSPYVRAKETVDSLCQGYGHAFAPFEEVPCITPEDDPRQLDAPLQELEGPVLIVSHNPYLSYFASWLLTGSFDRLGVRFKKAGLLCIEYFPRRGRSVGGAALLRWMVTPAQYRPAQ